MRNRSIAGPRPRLLALIVVLVLSLGAMANAEAQTVVADTESGPVEGLSTPTLTKFLGIPYAAPPVGALRWTPPQAPDAWTTPRDATVYAPHCAQPVSPFGQPSTSEDCLYLNVYVPNHHGFTRDRNRHRPVMVWIHGGAFSVGESDEYDPTRLVTTGDVVVVTINYRLGALGFMAHPALSAESPDGVSGNYGILDQLFALAWVQRNIAAFGGNPHRVTIFGESAGAISVHALMASPLGAGLFHRAISQSGGIFTQPTLATAEGRGTTLATALGCGDQTAACLRAVPVEQILASQGTDLAAASPNIDGSVLPLPMRDAFASGNFNRVPVMEGSNHDEFRLFVALLIELVSGPLTAEQYPDAVAAILGVPPAVVPLLISHYPLANYASPSEALGALATDASFACGARAAQRRLAIFTRTYAYEFNDANAPELFLPPVSFPYGAAHASEIQYIFDVPNVVGAPALTADQQTLADTMVHYWTRFARSAKPRAPQASRWRRYDPNVGDVLSLDAPSPTVETGFLGDHQCLFWDPLLGN